MERPLVAADFHYGDGEQETQDKRLSVLIKNILHPQVVQI